MRQNLLNLKKEEL